MNMKLRISVMKKQLATAALALTTAFAPLAANTNTPKTDPKDKNKTEINADTKLTKPVVKAGHYGDARVASKGEKLTMLVMMPEGWDQSGEEIATKLANAFADPKFTDYRVNVAVFHEEIENLKQPLVVIFMDGSSFVAENRAKFTLREVGGGIQGIAKIYLDEYGYDNMIPADAPVVLIPTND
jgi:hypothetical protein